MIILQPYHWRLSELVRAMQKRRLNDQEAVDMHHCLQLHEKYCWNIAKLEELSYLAHVTNDTDWQLEICARIDELMYGKTKKPGRKGTDKKKGQ